MLTYGQMRADDTTSPSLPMPHKEPPWTVPLQERFRGTKEDCSFFMPDLTSVVNLYLHATGHILSGTSIQGSFNSNYLSGYPGSFLAATKV
jgi:hypothetical protein